MPWSGIPFTETHLQTSAVNDGSLTSWGVTIGRKRFLHR